MANQVSELHGTRGYGISNALTSAPKVGKASSQGSFRPDIQGLRAIAVGVVVIYHASSGVLLPGGYVGVDIFFVISGFLITDHLRRELVARGTIDMGSFYARRARRILPVSLLVLLATLIAGFIYMSPLQWVSLGKSVIATAFYVPNYYFAVEGTDYLAETAPSPVQHYWSLGIEEQFYLFWPLILLVLWKVLRKKPQLLAAAILLVVLASFLLELVMMGRSQPWAFFSLPTRAWELGVGGLVALALANRKTSLLAPVVRRIATWVGLAFVLYACLAFDSTTWFPGFAAALPVLGVALVIYFGAGDSTQGVGFVLRRKPFQSLGDWSYSIYLVHWPLLVIPQIAVGLANPIPLWGTLLLGLASVPIAFLLFRFFETPIRKSRFLQAKRPRFTLFSALGASAIVALLASLLFPLAGSVPLATDRTAAPPEVTTQPIFTDFVPANLTPGLRNVSDESTTIHENGCHLDSDGVTPLDCTFGDLESDRTAVLYGDSHAAHWFPAFEKWASDNGIKLVTFTKIACPGIEAPIINQANRYTTCDTWRTLVDARIQELQPDYVFFVSSAHLPFVETGATREAQWNGAIEATIESMPKTSQSIVFADTPYFVEMPIDCLARNLDSAAECDEPRSEVLDQSWIDMESKTAVAAGAEYVDLNNFFCGDTTCGTIQGDTLMYRDNSHLTPTWARAMEPSLSEALGRLIPG